MKKVLTAALLCGATITGGNTYAQITEKCATTEIGNKFLAAHPEMEAAYHQYQQEVIERTIAYEEANKGAKKTTSTVTIPVVFHVILTQAEINDIGGTEAVYARAIAQLNVLNECFNASNSDTSKVPAVFKPLIGNTEMAFGPAHRTPAGKATPGVEIKIAGPGFPGFAVGDGSAKKAGSGGLDPWDNKKYLNVWVVKLSTANVLGYGYSPTYANLLNKPDETGIVVTYEAWGRRKSALDGSYINGAHLGRTLVHEMGHFFNLWHVWGNVPVGSGSCNKNDPDPLKYDDGVSDTPPQKDANQICPGLNTVIPNCTNTPGGEMFMNFMDYPGDECVLMFSKGQISRMKAEIAGGGPSYNLTTHPELLAWPTGIASVEKDNQFIIAPNPSTGTFTISFQNVQNLKNITIINMMGQAIRNINTTATVNSYNFDMSGMSKGIYTVQCNFEEGTVVRKIILQ
jgi:hypothetical protein